MAIRKLKPTHQLKEFPHLDVAAHQLSVHTALPPWCKNIRQRGLGWEVESKTGALVPAQAGDWVVAQIDENSMCILSDAEFKSLFVQQIYE